MFGLGLPELILILMAIFVLFGARKLPGLIRSTGESIRTFKKEVMNANKEIEARKDSTREVTDESSFDHVSNREQA